MNAYEFAKKYRNLKATVYWRDIEGIRTPVVFLRYCPKCGYGLPGMLDATGTESCIQDNCNYQRRPEHFTF